MASFTSRPVTEVLPKSARRGGTGERSKIAAEYRAALKDAIDQGQALVVEHEPGDKQLTIKNRIYAAAVKLGLHTDIVIKKPHKQPMTVAYLKADEEKVLAQLGGAIVEESTETPDEDQDEVEVPPMPEAPARKRRNKK